MSGGSPTLDTLLTISKNAGVSIVWLTTGNGPVKTSEPDDGADFSHKMSVFNEAAERYVAGKEGSDIFRVPFLSSSPAETDTSADGSNNKIGFYRDWLLSIGLSLNSVLALTMNGDSMAPTLLHGDIILIDSSKSSAKNPGIYVVRTDDRLMVKRIAPKIDGTLQVFSDNSVYPPEQVEAANVSALKIVGQVRWFGRAI